MLFKSAECKTKVLMPKKHNQPKNESYFANFHGKWWKPSRELTYPTWGKGKSSTQKCRLGWDTLASRRVVWCNFLFGHVGTLFLSVLSVPMSSAMTILTSEATPLRTREGVCRSINWGWMIVNDDMVTVIGRKFHRSKFGYFDRSCKDDNCRFVTKTLCLSGFSELGHVSRKYVYIYM